MLVCVCVGAGGSVRVWVVWPWTGKCADATQTFKSGHLRNVGPIRVPSEPERKVYVVT